MADFNDQLRQYREKHQARTSNSTNNTTSNLSSQVIPSETELEEQKKAYEKYAQMKADEELARKLQEEEESERVISMFEEERRVEHERVRREEQEREREREREIRRQREREAERRRQEDERRSQIYRQFIQTSTVGPQFFRYERHYFDDDDDHHVENYYYEGDDMDTDDDMFNILVRNRTNNPLLQSLLPGFRPPTFIQPNSADNYEFLLALQERMGTVNRGASQEQIDVNTSIYTINKPEDIRGDTSCSICLSDFAVHDKVRRLPCLHLFHVSCIDTWLQTNKTCPICKKDIV